MFGPPARSSSGISARQPAPAPSKSAKYTRLTRSMVSAMTSEITVPAAKNGSALAKYTSASVQEPGVPSRVSTNTSAASVRPPPSTARSPSLEKKLRRQPATT